MPLGHLTGPVPGNDCCGRGVMMMVMAMPMMVVSVEKMLLVILNVTDVL